MTCEVQRDQSNSIPKEIELKVKVSQSLFFQLQNYLKKKALLLGVFQIVDRFLDCPQRSFFFLSPKGFKEAESYLRVRESSINESICFKKVHRGSSGEYRYCDEIELVVEDCQKALLLLTQLGYQEIACLKKTRTSFLIGIYEISLDEVEPLGWFVEIELKAATENPEKSLQEIEDFLRNELQVQEYKKQSHGYLSMILNPHFDFSQNPSAT